eukprot:g7593.t1
MKLSCFVLALCAVASTGEASWDWYTGKSNKMPPAIRYTTSERAQKQRMNKLVGPKDSFGTMLGNVIVNQFDEDGDEDLGSWDWYTGKSNKMPPAIRYTTSERAQKQRMNKLVGPKDSFGTMLGNVIVNQFDEDGKRLDAKRRDAQRRARHRNRLAARANEHNQRSLAKHCKFNRCSERCHCEARGPYYLHHGECLTADNCCNTEGWPSGGSLSRYRNDLYSRYFPNVDPQLVQESMRNLDQRTAKNLFWSNCRK